MKKLAFILGLLITFTAGAQQLQEIDGVYYVDNEPCTGKFITYHDNGKIKMEAFFNDGMKDGETKIYFENGGLNEIRNYKNNEMNGIWLTFNMNGKKVSEASYKNGKKDGHWYVWNEEGNMLYELCYKNGEKTGTWKNYDENGLVVNERNYSEM